MTTTKARSYECWEEHGMFWCRCTKCGRVVQGKYEDRGTGKQVWYDTEHECKEEAGHGAG